MTEEARSEAAGDIRPQVARPGRKGGVWLFGGCLVLGALGLFSALEARRAEISSPAIAAPAEAARGMIAPPPPLAIPTVAPAYMARSFEYGPTMIEERDPRGIRSAPSTPPAALPPRRNSPVSESYFPSATSAMPVYPPLQPVPAPPLSPPRSQAPATPETTNRGDKRAEASRLVNPATTVPQGTVIQAVLETALDSNRAGFARAIVSRDVASFDGTRVLIPRGSKLFGEYKADLGRGQNRALIQWRRLMRPDGSIIDVDSPSADPLGRAGVRGKVNSHFFERFGGAILQSVLDIGTQVAARQIADDAIILNLPTNTMPQIVQPGDNVRPTVTVKHGTSVSVFVGRDLDFTLVEP